MESLFIKFLSYFIKAFTILTLAVISIVILLGIASFIIIFYILVKVVLGV